MRYGTVTNTVGSHKNLTTVKRRKLIWDGQLTRCTGLAKKFYKELYKEREREEDRERGGRTTSQRDEKALSGNLRSVEDREKWG